MSLLRRLESKLGRFAVPNVTAIIIAGQVLLYVVTQFNEVQGGGDMLERFRFYPAKVLSGEVWRLVTFVFDPPMTNVLFAFFFWYLFYLFGSTLEGTWGVLRYNVFLLVGYVATVATALGAYLLTGIDLPATNGFLYGTVFLAFAKLYPDFVLQIMFVLPVKVKWLALLQWIGYAFGMLFGTWMTRAMIVASVANYLLFFGREWWRDLRFGHRRMQFQSRAVRGQNRILHKCRTCGLTSDDAPQMQFRYCSKCADDCCYCADHLQNHEHVTAPTEQAAGKK